ncbi:hypothetical protein [Schlesneria paludicola]|uniref:hypothetical protein n=1 Tax=Schlesneria paludicola TaxID=360056 RepID=UPI00029A2E37|nr:hypothetical protein [Schlesneria paludicola]
MADEPDRRRDWAVTFLGRLCLIGWTCAILYEAFDFLKPVRQICLLFGPWACVIALVNAIGLLLIRRRGIFLLFLLLIIPPTVHFGMVLRNIADQKLKLYDAGTPTNPDAALSEPPPAN